MRLTSHRLTRAAALLGSLAFVIAACAGPGATTRPPTTSPAGPTAPPAVATPTAPPAVATTTLCAASEFIGRDDGLPGLEAAYGFEFSDVATLELGLIPDQIDAGGPSCVFGEVFATDSRIAALGLLVLEDDLAFFPVYEPSLNVRQEVFDANPDLADLFAPIAAALDTVTMQGLNSQVDQGGENEADVAAQFLTEMGAMTGPDLTGATFAVGSKEFTEQLILGQITIQALEAAGATVEDQTGLIGSTVVRDALTGGDIDMYWEYTGTGWINHLGNTTPVVGTEEQFIAVRDADAANMIVWLEPAPLNNTYAIAVASETAADMGLTTLSDLAALANGATE